MIDKCSNNMLNSKSTSFSDKLKINLNKDNRSIPVFKSNKSIKRIKRETKDQQELCCAKNKPQKQTKIETIFL